MSSAFTTAYRKGALQSLHGTVKRTWICFYCGVIMLGYLRVVILYSGWNLLKQRCFILSRIVCILFIGMVNGRNKCSKWQKNV